MANMFNNPENYAFDSMANMVWNFYDALIQKGFEDHEALEFTKIFLEATLNQA